MLTLTRADVDSLEALWTVTQPQLKVPLRYWITRDPNGERVGELEGPRDEAGLLESLEHLRELMLAVAPDGFIVVRPPEWS